MTTPPLPIQTQQQPQQPDYSGMLRQAMQSLSGSPFQGTPQQGGSIDSSSVLGKIIGALAQGAGAYGWAGMTGQEREQRTAMEQQKAEAMARIAGQQQQLGLEQQRVGIEQQRAGTEASAQRATEKYQTGELAESAKRTGIAQQQADIEKQRADQEHEAKTRELDIRDKQFNAEYGIGGLRSREVATRESEAATASRRAAAEEERNKIDQERDEAEANFHMASLKAQGLQTDRAAIEDKRKEAHAGIDKDLEKHFWFYDSKETLADTRAKRYAAVDEQFDAQLAQAEKAAGTGAGAGTGGMPSGQTPQHTPGGQAQGLQEGATGTGSDGKKYVVKGGTWQPATGQ